MQSVSSSLPATSTYLPAAQSAQSLLDELPTTVEELQQLLLQAQQKNVELAATVDSQKQQLKKSERTICELLQALRGKQRERVDPNRLLLFEIGELEPLIEEKAAEQYEVARPTRRRRKSRQRVLPDNLPREEIVHELPEDQRQCLIDGKPMPVIC